MNISWLNSLRRKAIALLGAAILSTAPMLAEAVTFTTGGHPPVMSFKDATGQLGLRNPDGTYTEIGTLLSKVWAPDNAGGGGGGIPTFIGDCTNGGTTTILCTKTNGVAFAPSATVDTSIADNITTGTLNAARIANNTLVNAKLAQMAGTTIKCNSTASTANVADCTPQAVGTVLNTVSSAPQPQTSNITLTASNQSLPVRMLAAAANDLTVTLPSSVPAGFYTGLFSNESSFQQIVQVPSGGIIDFITNGTTVIKPGQRVVMYYDTDGWHTAWIDRAGSDAGRNRITNGAFAVSQYNGTGNCASTAGADRLYCIDRWYLYSTGGVLTGSQVAGSGSTPFRYQVAGATGVTAGGLCQRIPSARSYDLNSGYATLSVDVADSTLTAVGWQLFYAATVDTFGTLASPTRTSISSGTFTVTSALKRQKAVVAIPSAAITGIEVCFSVGAQVSGNLLIGNVQLEPGNFNTPYETRSYFDTLQEAQYFFQGPVSQVIAGYAVAGSGVALNSIRFPHTMRATPTVSNGSITYTNSSSFSSGTASVTGFNPTLTVTATGAYLVTFTYTALAEL